MTDLTWCTVKASWPGPDPAIHGYAAPQNVDARIKSGHDGFNHRDGETVRSTGIEASPLDLRVSVVKILDAPHGGGA